MLRNGFELDRTIKTSTEVAMSSHNMNPRIPRTHGSKGCGTRVEIIISAPY